MQLSGFDKAAILLSSIGEEVASEVLRGLDVEDIGRLTKHISRLTTVHKGTIDDVFKEVTGAIDRGNVRVGGEEFARRVLLKGLGEDGAAKVLEMASREGPLDALKRADPKSLAAFLSGEHPQTAALVICLLEAGQAAEVLSLLPEKLRPEVCMRIASSERIPEHAIEELKEELRGQLDVGNKKGKRIGGAKTLAEILNRCDRTTEETVLEKMEERNGQLADSVRRLMFVFDDLVMVDNRGIQTLLKEVSTEDLSVALKTASEALREKIFKNMSQRAGDILKEEMQTRGPVRVSDVERAQQSIIKTVRSLEAEGRIVVARMDGEEVVE
ncbi:MAG: flagellar motor switch protein FliG [Chloroflexota bacterium]